MLLTFMQFQKQEPYLNLLTFYKIFSVAPPANSKYISRQNWWCPRFVFVFFCGSTYKVSRMYGARSGLARVRTTTVTILPAISIKTKWRRPMVAFAHFGQHIFNFSSIKRLKKSFSNAIAIKGDPGWLFWSFCYLFFRLACFGQNERECPHCNSVRNHGPHRS